MKKKRTPAFKAFWGNMQDVTQLLEIHGKFGGAGPDVLNNSAVVLLVACWEAYLEDLVSYAYDRRLVLAGRGWRKVLTAHKSKTIKDFRSTFSENVNRFFSEALAIPKISQSWHWPGMTEQRARKELDNIVHVRGSIAHRVRRSPAISLSDVTSYQDHISRLVEHTDLEVWVSLKLW